MEEKTPDQSTTQSQPHPSQVPIFLIVFGCIGLILTVIASIGITISVRQIHNLYSDLSLELPTYQFFLPYIGIAILCFIPLIQIIYGLRLRSINKNSGTIPNRQHTIGLLMLIIPIVLPFLAAPLYILSAINPIYSLVENVDTKPTLTVTPVIKSSGESAISNWKTYRNDDYGFEFQYPPDLAVDYFRNDSFLIAPSDLLKTTLEAEKMGYGPILGKQVPILLEAENKDGEFIYDNIMSYSNEYQHVKQLTTDVIKTKKYEIVIQGDSNEGAKRIIYILENGSKSYAMVLSDFQYEKTFKQILSTFKTIESSSPIIVSFESAYSDISFKYPANWKVRDQIDQYEPRDPEFQKIEIFNEHGELRMYITKPDYADGCDVIPNSTEIVLQVGLKEQNMKPICGFYLGEFKGFYIMNFFMGTPDELAGKELLKSLN